MKKEDKNLVIGVITIIMVTIIIVFAFDSFLNKKEMKKEKEEIKFVRIVDVNLVNSIRAEQEYHTCLLCKVGGTIADCRSKSLKLSFQVDTNLKYISCKVYNNREAEGLGYLTAYAGMNVYTVFRDYHKSPQEYKVCCIYTFSKSNSTTCSEEYNYSNPC